MNPPQGTEKERHLIDYLIAILGILLAILLFFLVRQYEILRREQIIGARESWIMAALKNHQNPVINEVADIRAWMTFDYLNKRFDLPPDYLRDRLSISDPAYPRLTIGKFAKDLKQSASSTLTEVQNVLQQDLAPPNLGNTSST